MKTENILRIQSIEDNPETVKALLAFAHIAGDELTLTNYLNQVMADKQLTAPQVYHRAELDRQTYNRLIQYSNPRRAAKRTLMQICIGIFATEREAEELLGTCGYTFSADTEDKAFLFCIRKGLYTMYNVWEAIDILNEAAKAAENHSYQSA